MPYIIPAPFDEDSSDYVLPIATQFADFLGLSPPDCINAGGSAGVNVPSTDGQQPKFAPESRSRAFRKWRIARRDRVILDVTRVVVGQLTTELSK